MQAAPSVLFSWSPESFEGAGELQPTTSNKPNIATETSDLLDIVNDLSSFLASMQTPFSSRL